MCKIRTRYAPSPTGFMHVGNIRTALYTYFIAKKDDGTFILRIEDTDQNRLVDGAVEKIYSDLKSLGIQWDEGPDVGGEYGPYIQTERKGRYLEYAKKLVEEKKAYYCFCSEERLNKLREESSALGKPFKYDGRCANLSEEEYNKRIENGEKPVIRFKMPKTGNTTFHDEVFGDITVKNSELEDLILIKSDGLPTYNFANVIDDHEMAITHVVRGNEYISSTPKYELIYHAFGWDTPKYIHVPMINKNDGSGKKLGKRDGDVTFESLLDKGYLKETIINFITLLGWSPGGEQEIFSMDELVKTFDVKGISKSPAVYDVAKLNWMNGQYIRKSDIEYITELSIPFLIEEGLINKDTVESSRDKITKIISAVRGNVDYLAEIPNHARIFFEDEISIEDEEAKEIINKDHVNELMIAWKNKIESLEQVTGEDTKTLFKEIQKETSIKGKDLYMPTRVALTGQIHGPEMVDVFDILGKESIIKRIDKIIKNK